MKKEQVERLIKAVEGVQESIIILDTKLRQYMLEQDTINRIFKVYHEQHRPRSKDSEDRS
jgi:hypothetical protein